MATLLWVENAQPFDLDQLLPKAGVALKFILGLTSPPELIGVQTWQPEAQLPKSYHVEMDSSSFGIKVDGENAMVYVAPSKNYGHICISPDGWRSKLEYALAAAVAIALAESFGTKISDPGCAYVRAPSNQAANKFAESIKVKGTFDDINEAANAFFSRLTVPSERH
jgi:hypothetical protein